jgi:apolipoprotein N-acyltransferase
MPSFSLSSDGISLYLLKYNTMVKTQFIEKYKYTGLSVLSGLLLHFSWPPNGYTPLIFIAFIPLFFIDDLINKSNNKKSFLFFFYNVFLCFLTWNALSTFWIGYSSVYALIAALVLNSLFMSFPWLLLQYSRRKLPGYTGAIVLILFWLSFEYLHLRWDLSWPWLNLGNVFAQQTKFIQWYEYTGVLGGSAWILIINLMLFYSLKSVLEKKNRIITKILPLIFASAIIVIPALLSIHIGSSYIEKTAKVEVLIVQPGHSPYDVPSTMAEITQRLNLMNSLSEKNITAETSVIISPEASIPSTVWKNNTDKNPGIRSIKSFSKKHDNIAWIAGGFVNKSYSNNEKAPYTAKRSKETQEYHDVYNSSLLIKGNDSIQYYHKSRLVPGSEAVPFYKYVKLLSPAIERLGGVSGSYGFQKHRSVFIINDSVIVAPIICYESVFGEYVCEYVKQGATILGIQTNDGWWKNTSGYKQHFHYARLRAIETRRSVARAASTGISGFIDQKGNVIKVLGWNKSGALTHSINANDTITFYVKNGDYLGRLSVFISILIVLYVITQRIIRR